jgi:N-ethylmaleimide reductase
MTLTDIETVISDYAAAARQARRAGFDGVEIAANGTYLISQFLNPRLNRRSDQYGACRHRLLPVPGAAPDFDAIARYRKLFGGPLIANHGFGRETGNAIVEAGIADAVSFARLFIANPDLVTRFALGGGLAASDRSTHYRGSPRGYTDSPMWAPSGTQR